MKFDRAMVLGANTQLSETTGQTVAQMKFAFSIAGHQPKDPACYGGFLINQLFAQHHIAAAFHHAQAAFPGSDRGKTGFSRRQPAACNSG